MSIKNFGLIARSNQFNSVIANSICTNTHGETQDLEHSINKTIEQLTLNRNQGNALYLVGNGGSAAIASHAITDFLNVCRLRAFVLHESSLITCMSNDFGYENAFARIVNTVFHPGDVL